MKEEILQYLHGKMEIDDISGDLMVTKVSGSLFEPIERTIREIKDYFSRTDYTPLFTQEKGKNVVMFGIFKKSEHNSRYWLNVLLFMATLITTLYVGSGYNGGNPLENLNDIWLGIPFSLSLMAILTCHELGHYFVSKKQGMVTTLPYFIPAPFLFGTFGAVIRMKSIIPSRSSLLKVGMAGPLAGFIVALPIAIIGIMLSTVQSVPEGVEVWRFGNSLLFSFLARILHPQMPVGYDLYLHPMALAGWIGLWITSINLIPIGQLDGGHIAYSVFLGKRRMAYIPIFAVMIILGIFLYKGWIVWALLAFFISRRDPMVQDTITSLTLREKMLALVPLIIFVLTLIPQPFAVE
ncbi:MAG: site-2 protease family protein [candidate division WOR-3 bacterium]|nr:MAG: site-2 protease family protein [candidate division WOR-3 bacterium]